MRYILFALIIIFTLIPLPADADKAVDSFQKMAGVQVVTDSNVDVTYTGKHWLEDGEDKYEYVARIHQAPIYNEDGTLVDCSWHGSEDAYVIVNNVFSAQVIGSYITVTYQGKSMSWNPVVMIDSKEYAAKKIPTLLAVDPINSNYKNNTLEWDYGVCVRRVRVIEGLIQETWTFSQDPKGNVWIRDNAQKQAGFTWAIAPYGYDADGNAIAVNEYKQVAASVMASAKYPVTIDPTEVFVTSASDGLLRYIDAVYATAHDAASAETVASTLTSFFIGQSTSAGFTLDRSYVYFDTSALPDSAIISASNLSLYGASDSSTADFNIVVQNGQPDYPHDPLVVGDWDYTKYTGAGSAFSTAGFSITGYNNVSLTAAGLTYISVTGITKLALLSSEDIADSAPAGLEQVTVYSYEKGAGFRPTLYVTYVSSGPPDVSSVAATYVTKATARVNGYLDSDGGEVTTVWFNYWEWYDANWSDCIEFSINASYVDSDLTNFPVLITGAQVNQSNPNFWTTVDVNGSDILFTDENGVKLNRELVSIDTTAQTMECYVNVTSIDDTTDTKFYMYYNSANISLYNESNSVQTWDTNYIAVWHMGDLNTSAISDSTVNGYTGTKKGANEPLESSGNFNGDKSQYNDGTDYINISTISLNNTWSISALLYTSNDSLKSLLGDSNLNYGYLSIQDVNKRLYFEPSSVDIVVTLPTYTSYGSVLNKWAMINAVMGGTLLRAYVDTVVGTPVTPTNNVMDLNISYIMRGYSTNYFVGNISELRISNTNRSAAFINASYFSMMIPTSFAPVTDVFTSTTTQSKNTGDSFYSSLSGLTADTLYGFRAMGTQTQGTDYGEWMFFDTTVTLGAPSNVTCNPDSDSITLSWVKGGNTSYTYIRYKTGGYPTGTADGNAIALQSGVDYVHTGLTSGVTYYYKMWGEDSGTYSTTNTTIACTTNAGFATASPVPLPTTDTSGWSEEPNGSVFENNPLYALGNLEADEVGVPHNTWWMLLALGGLVCTGLFIYTRSRNLLAALGAMIIFGVIMAQAGLFPIWTMIIFGLMGIGFGWKEIR